ncbi:hypothetical protein, partial [Pseudomonas syringae]
LAGTILFHGCEFCLLCIFTHDASKGCIQPSGVTPDREERWACPKVRSVSSSGWHSLIWINHSAQNEN